MEKIGIFYGSTTGNTENAAKLIQKSIGIDLVDIYDVENASIDDVNKYKNLAFAIPTWDIGELQEDWISWINNLDKPNMLLEGKHFSVFGVGDQDGYPDTFGDAIGIIYDKIIARGGIPVIDKWTLTGYKFEASKGQKGEYFVGMMLDEDCQPEKTKDRIAKWVELAKKEYK